MVNVVKRSGKRQKFSGAKLGRAIEKAAREAKVPAAKRKALAKEVSASVQKALKRTVKAVELRTKVLRRLESRSKKTVRAWRRHDRKKKR